MGSKDEDARTITTPREAGEVSASNYAAYGHQASTGSVGSPPERGSSQEFANDAAWSMQSPVRGSIAHDHLQFAMLQSQSSQHTPKSPDSVVSAPRGFVDVSNVDPSDFERRELEAVSPSSAPGGRGRYSNDGSAGGGLNPRYYNSNDRRYAASSPGGRLSRLGDLSKTSLTFVSQRNISRDAAQELARQALSHRKVSVGDVTFDNPRDSNLRESVRRVHAYSRREAPLDYEATASVRFKNKSCQLTMDREIMEWKRSATRVVGRIETDDIVAAHALPSYGRKEAKAAATSSPSFRVHYFKKGRGNNEKALKRKHKFVDFTCDNGDIAEKWIHTIQELVRWQARAPPIAEKRKIKIVVNPHSGKRRATRIYNEQVKHFFDWGNFDCVVEETTYSGHAIEMGRKFSADDGFESLVFIGGDGTLCEFMNGLLSRPEHEWREIVATTPISLISAGTQNAFGAGVGIPTIESAVYCIIKRKMRPLDVITAVAEHEPNQVHYSYCGVGWGIAGDIAAESEKFRWMGTFRYAYLKLKRTILAPKRHTGRVRYVPTDPQPKLRKYFDIRDEGALDQFEMEEGNVYDSMLENNNPTQSFSQQGQHSFSRQGSLARKSWGGFGGAIRSPASHKRYPDNVWVEEKGQYFVVGVVNAAPDGVYAHPSDGNLDLIISRKANFLRMFHFGILYLLGKEFESDLISYIKVKAVVIEQDADQAANGMNIDGEVLPGPGPWRMEVVPSLFKALSEK